MLEKGDADNIFRKAVKRHEIDVIVDPISLGWMRSLRVISVIKAFPHIIVHRALDHKISFSEDCLACSYPLSPDYRDCEIQAKDYIYNMKLKLR